MVNVPHDIDPSAGSGAWSTIFDVAKAIGHSYSGAYEVAVREHITSGKSPGSGRPLRIHPDRLEEFAQRHVRPTTGRPALQLDDPSLISVSEAAKIVDVPGHTLRYWMRKGWIDGWEHRAEGFAFRRDVIEDFAGVSPEADQGDVAS